MSPDIPDHDIAVYSIVPGSSPECPNILSGDERKAAARKVRPSDRAAYVACRTLLRRLLACHLGCVPSLVPIKLTTNGQPKVEDCGLSFSISHTDGLSLVAVARDRRLGIDLERLDRKVDVSLLANTHLPRHRRAAVLNASEKDRNIRFLADWTRHEALAKATGRGLVFPADETMSDAAGLVVRQFEGIPDYVAAVAADGSDWRPRWGQPETPAAVPVGIRFGP